MAEDNVVEYSSELEFGEDKYKCYVTHHKLAEDVQLYRGYVTVPNHHPFYGMNCDEVMEYIKFPVELTFSYEGKFGFDTNYYQMQDNESSKDNECSNVVKLVQELATEFFIKMKL